MIEIGKLQTKLVKKKDKKTGKMVQALDTNGEPETRAVSNEVWRVTRDTLGGQFGIDGKRKLVVGFTNGDLITMRPQGTRQTISLDLKEVYAWALKRKASTKVMEKLRKKKAQKAEIRHRREMRKRFK